MTNMTLRNLYIYICMYIFFGVVVVVAAKFSFLGIVTKDFCSTTHCGLRRTSSSIFIHWSSCNLLSKWYGWWKKSCSSWYGKNWISIIYKVLYIPGGAGFLPSAVSSSITASLLSVFCFHDQTLKDLKSWLVVEPTHLKNMLVKLDHFPRGPGENPTNICATTTQFLFSPPNKKSQLKLATLGQFFSTWAMTSPAGK